MMTDSFVEREIHGKKFRIQLGFKPKTTYSDVLTIKPLGPLAEEQKTSYISSIA